MTTVYFCQRPLHRTRQRETVDHCPPEIHALRPADVRFAVETNIRAKHFSAAGRARQLALNAVPLNARRITDPQREGADLLYTWGCIPLNDMPYVVELDNPYVLAFYSLRRFALVKPLLRRVLLGSRCRRIVCVSEACKTTLRTELGGDVADKAAVVYPYIREQTAVHPSFDGVVNFLFVSQEYDIKGGRETLHAFERLVRSGARAHLHMVTNVPREVADEYRHADWLTLLPAKIDKRELHDRYFRQAHVYVMPTYVESFGMVYLEALSFGLPIIAVPTYAVPEMVKDGVNGVLLDAPFPFFLPDGRANPELWPPKLSWSGLADRIRQASYPRIEESLLAALQTAMDPARRRQMAEASRSLFQATFTDDVRARAFVSALQPP